MKERKKERMKGTKVIANGNKVNDQGIGRRKRGARGGGESLTKRRKRRMRRKRKRRKRKRMWKKGRSDETRNDGGTYTTVMGLILNSYSSVIE